MKTITKALLLLGAISLTACGGGGGGGTDSGSTSQVGTGFLKVNLPIVSTASSSSLSLLSIADSRGVSPATTISQATVNSNNGLVCSGATQNIPFILCMVESYGINAVGTYTGTTPSGNAVSAVVSNLSSDPNGYTLQAEVSLDSNSQKILIYRADANGEKGMVEALPAQIFGESNTGNYGFRITWDKTSSPAVIEYVLDQTSSSQDNSSYLLALVDEAQGTTDIASKEYAFNTILDEATSTFVQIRSNSSRTLSLASTCTNNSSPTEGSECFSFSDTTLFDADSNGNQLECFDSSTLSSQTMTLSDSMALSNASAGSMAISGTFTDSSCEALKNLNSAGSTFSIRIDKDDSSANTLNGIFHDMRAETFSNINLLSNSGFLN